MLTKRKGEQKAYLNAVASNTIASLSNILPTVFVVHLKVKVLMQNNQGSTCTKYINR